MPKRNEEAKILLSKSTAKIHFSINKFDDVELKILVEDIHSLENSTLTLYIEKPNGHIDKTSKLNKVLDNIAEFIISSNSNDKCGICKAQLKVVDGDGRISSSIFMFNVLNTIIDDSEPIPPSSKIAICGTFECGELICGEGLEIKEVKSRSSLSKEFLEAFGGGLNE